MAKNNNNNNGKTITTEDLTEVREAARKASRTAVETGNVAAGLAEATAAVKVESVGGATDALAGILAQLAAMQANQAAMIAAMTAPKVRTVKVTADGTQVVSSGKRGKPPTAGLDDCRDDDGKVRKVGVRAYESECSGDRVGTFRIASRGAHGTGRGECISKVAACPYSPAQQAAIATVSELLPFGLRFRLVKVTDATVKLAPARTLTEVEASQVGPLLAPFGLEVDLWTRLRTTVDGSGEGEIPSTPEA